MHAPRTGFTLIEMIVSVAIFAIVMLVATSAFLSIISLDRRARSTNDLVTNLNFAVDNIERSLRTGTNFQCGGAGGGDCTTANNTLTFVNDQGQTITYRLDTTHHSIGQCTGNGTCNDTTDQSLTDPRINVTGLSFFVRGVTDPNLQPWATFTTTGSLTPDPVIGPITFTIESTASQRVPDL